jgi:hypothetical protein
MNDRRPNALEPDNLLVVDVQRYDLGADGRLLFEPSLWKVVWSQRMESGVLGEHPLASMLSQQFVVYETAACSGARGYIKLARYEDGRMSEASTVGIELPSVRPLDFTKLGALSGIPPALLGRVAKHPRVLSNVIGSAWLDLQSCPYDQFPVIYRLR